MLTIEVKETIGRAFDQLERELEAELRALASRTGRAVRDTARAAVAVDKGVTRDHIISEDREDGTRVYVASTPERPTNLDIWLEFGTRRMAARPFLHPAAALHQRRFEREVAQRLRAVVARTGGGR